MRSRAKATPSYLSACLSVWNNASSWLAKAFTDVYSTENNEHNSWFLGSTCFEIVRGIIDRTSTGIIDRTSTGIIDRTSTGTLRCNTRRTG